MFGVTTLVLIITALINFSITPTYRASASIRIEPEAARIFPQQDMFEASASFLETEAYLETQCEVLRSVALSERVVKKLDLDVDPRWIKDDQKVLCWLSSLKSSLVQDRAGDVALTEKLLDNLEVEPRGRSRIVEISYHSPYPDLASSIVNTLSEEFVQYNIESRFSTTSKAAGFITTQLEKLKERIAESEKQLLQYVRKNGIVGISETENVITQRLADLTESRTKVETDLILKQAAYTEIQEANSDRLPQTLKNEEISGLESRLHELEQELANLNAVHGARWPAVIQVRHEISEVVRQLQQEREFALGEAVEQAKLDYEVARNTYEGLIHSLKKQKELATHVNEATIQYSILRREVEANKEVYEGLIQKVNEAGVAAGLSSVNIQIVDSAKIPSTPHRPLTLLNLLLGLVVGVMAGVGIALLLEYTNKTVRTPDDLERHLALSCLGVIPTLPKSSNSGALGKGVLEGLEDSDRALEAYRSLRTAILISKGKAAPQTILVTSALPDEGKTTTATRLAFVLAQTGQPTLVLDLDLRRPEISKRFNISPDLGLSYVLRDGLPVAGEICETRYPNLYLLPGGKVVANASELIGSRKMFEIIALLKEHFRFIVIDSAPVLSFTDTTIFAPSVDATVIVVRGGRTCYSAPKKARQILEAAGGRVHGAVINDVDVTTASDEAHLLGYYPVQGYGYDTSGTRV